MSDEYMESVAAQRRAEAAYWETWYWQVKVTPFVLYGARIFQDGGRWCALLGVNIQEGVCGFGDSPEEAKDAFNKAWHEKIVTSKPEATDGSDRT